MRGIIDRMEVLRFMSLNQTQGGFVQILSSAQRAACQKAAGSTEHRDPPLPRRTWDRHDAQWDRVVRIPLNFSQSEEQTHEW